MARHALLIGLLLIGCAPRSPSWQFSDNYVTYATFPLQLLDAETGKPLANVAIARVEDVPNPESLSSRLLYGNQKFLHTPLDVTNNQGIIGVQMRHRGETLVFRVGEKEYYINCTQLTIVEVEASSGIHPNAGSISIDEEKHVIVKIYPAQSK